MKFFSKLNILFILFVVFLPVSVSAIKYKAAVPVSETFAKEITVDGKTLGVYVEDMYKYSLGVIGILATIVMMWGGICWITAGGSSESIGEAKAWIMASISGIVIALSSFSILYFINPDLVKFREVSLPGVEGTYTDMSGYGCCEYTNSKDLGTTRDVCLMVEILENPKSTPEMITAARKDVGTFHKDKTAIDGVCSSNTCCAYNKFVSGLDPRSCVNNKYNSEESCREGEKSTSWLTGVEFKEGASCTVIKTSGMVKYWGCK